MKARRDGSKGAIIQGLPMIEESGFAKALHSEGPASDRTEQLKLYGWLIGD